VTQFVGVCDLHPSCSI